LILVNLPSSFTRGSGKKEEKDAAGKAEGRPHGDPECKGSDDSGQAPGLNLPFKFFGSD